MVDHIEPSKGRIDVFEREANHIGLCHHCHNTITGRFDYKFVAGGDLTNKLTWIATERARNEITKARAFARVKVLRYRE